MKGERDNPHRTRKILLRYLSENPGSTILILSSALRINKSTLRYHLRYLDDKDEIFSVKRRGKRRYYLKGKENHPVNDITRNQERVLTLIRSKPGITRKQIRSQMNLTSRSLTYVLKSLRGDQLIWEDKGKYTAVTPENLADRMLVVLVKKLLNGRIDEETFLAMKEEIERKR
mgnify:CR=1 FL=1